MMLPTADSTDSIGWEAKAQEIPAQPWGSNYAVPKVSEKTMEVCLTSSSVLAWRIPWMEGPGGLWSMGLQRVGHD